MDSNEKQRRRSSNDSSDMEALEKGITTRVLADRLRSLSQSSSESERRHSIGEQSRRTSKFLAGTAIPNSVIKSSLNVKEPIEKDSKTLRTERDARVSQIMETLLPKYKKRVSYDESRDLEALAKIRKELQKRSSILQASNKEKIDDNKSDEGEMKTTNDSKEEIVSKQKRRSSCITESFLPLSCNNRAPTFESVKRAVENASTSKVLINADELTQTTQRKSSNVQEGSFESLNHQPTTSFITRRKFISKLEKGKESKVKQSSLEVLQQGINRPSMLFKNKSGTSTVGFDEESKVTVLKYILKGQENAEN